MSGTNILTAAVVLGGSAYLFYQCLTGADVSNLERRNTILDVQQRQVLDRYASELEKEGDAQGRQTSPGNSP